MADRQISRSDYNGIRQIVNNVLGVGGTNPTTGLPDATFGYGQSLTSSEIGSGDVTITEAQWDALRADINKAYTHQVGSATNIPDVTTSTRVGYSQVYQTYLAAANDIVTNRALFAGSQRPQSPVTVSNGAKTTTTPWSVSITQTLDVVFNSAAEARYFFNSGATINFRSSRTGGTTSPQNAAAQNNSWTTFLNTVGTLSFGKTEFYALTSGGLSELATPVFLRTAPAPYSNNYFRIYANCNVPNNTNGTATFLSFKIEWIDSTTIPNILTDYIDGTLTSTISETKSIGVVSILSPTSYTVGELTPSGTAVNLSASFELTSNVDTVNEGGTVTYTLRSRNYPSNKTFQLEISGVSDSDLVGSTTGIKTIITQGNDTLASVSYSVVLANDLVTDPLESITARVTVAPDGYQTGEVLTKTVVINDSSTAPTPSLSISATSANSIQGEGFGSASTVTVTNTGSKVLSISNIGINKGSFLTDYSADFTGMSGASTFSATTIAIGQSKTFTVRFSGSTVGTQTAVVTITSDGNDTAGGGSAPGSNKQANISAVVATATFGIATTPSLAYTTSFASDGATPGDTALQTITISNSTGNATVTLGSPAVTVSSLGSLTHTLVNAPNGLTIAPGATRSFQIKFTGVTVPSSTQPVISIDCGLGGTKNITATVTGTQSLPSIATSTPSVVATSRIINIETTSGFSISNPGSAALVVSNIAIAGQNSYSTYSVSPTTMTIQPGSSQSVTVTSKRSRIGTDPATITITSNAPSPNNSKTVSFSMTSTALVPTYNISMSETTTTNPSVIPKGRKNTSINSYISGAEPNATGYVYHEQSGNRITGIPAGTSAVQAFSQKLGSRNVDGSGVFAYWVGAAPDELKAWDVGISKAWAWVPIGKLDDGTQKWWDGPNKGGSDQGYVQMEVLPSLTLSVSTTSVDLSKVDLTPLPKVTYSVSGGIPNTPIKLFIAECVAADGQPLPTGDIATLDGSGNWSQAFEQGAGQNIRVVYQTYGGATYKSNAVTVTGYSPEYFPVVYGFPGTPGGPDMNADACWENASQQTNIGTVFRYYRSFAATPGVTYTVYCQADDAVWLVINYPNFALSGGLGSFATGTFVQPSGRTRAYISWTTLNHPGAGGSWTNNPAAFSIQVFHGGTKVWGTRSSTARGY